MRDISIPRTRRHGAPRGSTYGWFVRTAADEVVLRDRRNNRWPLNQVSICYGAWGFDDEGVAKLPRPAEYNAAGEEVVLGDRLLIHFIDGSRKKPVVQPGFRRIKANAGSFLPYNHNLPDKGADENRLAARLQPRDVAGAVVGSVDFEAGYDNKAAARLSVGPAEGGGPRTYVSIDDDDGSAQIGTKGGAVVRLAPGQVAFQSEEGHLFLLDAENGIQLAWKKPNGSADPMINAKAGLLLILSTLTQVVGRLELSDGTVPLSPLLVQGTAGAGLYFDLAAAMTQLGGPPASSTAAAALALKLNAELASPGANPGYGSSVAKSTG